MRYILLCVVLYYFTHFFFFLKIVFFFLIFFFICKMLIYGFWNFYIILPFAVISYYLYNFFFKHINYSSKYKGLASDKSLSKYSIKKTNPLVFFNFAFFTLLFFMIYIYICKNYDKTCFYGHLFINNFTFCVYFYVFCLGIYLLKNVYNRQKWINFIANDYLFILVNITLWLPLIFFTKNLITFFFLLELTSNLLLYKFIISKIAVKKQNKIKKDVNPKSYFITLFYQFWAAFFSSVLFVITILNLIFYFSSTEWFIFNFFISFDNVFYVNSVNLYMFVIFFILAFFIKLGITPAQLFKIEVYKGIPFVTIFFYTIFYFFIFFLFLSILFIGYLPSVYNFFWFCFVPLCVFGLIYILFLFFDATYVKAFFAYSTVLNVLNFFIIILIVGA